MAPGSASVRVGPSPPSAAAGTLFLAPPVGQLDIRIVDEAGRAIPDAGLRLIGDTAGVSDVALDTSGGAMPVVTPGRWLVESTAPGRGRQLHQIEVQPLVPFSHSLAITLLPEIDADTTLTVEVVDADGVPVSGALLFSGERLLATTGSSGLVTIEGLAAGEMSLRLEHPEFLPETARLVTLEPGTESSASFALGWLPGALVLRVTDADGRPSDSTVRLEGAGKTIIGRTGPDGLFSEVLAAGDWSARLADTDRAPVGVDFEVVPGRNRQLAIKLVARVMPDVAGEAAQLAVRVTDEGDAPVEGVRVQLGGQLLGTTSTEGTLRVAGLPLGEAMVEVNGEFFDRWTTRVELESTGDQVVDANLRSRLGQVVLVAIDPSEEPIEAQVRITGASGQTSLSRLGSDGQRSYRLAEGAWEFAFASERNGFGVEDLTVEREQAKYEVRWVGDQDGAATVLALPPKRPVEVQLWSLPADAPTSGTLRLLGPDILPPFELGEDGLWRDELRVGQWEALATAPDLGIGGDELIVSPQAELVSMRVELGTVEVELTAEEVTIDDALYFGKGSAVLADRAQGSLAAVARTLRGSPSVRRVQIEGHADQSGSLERNQSLSEDRAQAVYSALLDLGVESYRLETVGYGETRPVAVGLPDGAARSRRVVFRVVEVQDAVRLAPEKLSDGTVR
jgi:outer membrane protein OmpA-like peptidoglycan-associated protein